MLSVDTRELDKLERDLGKFQKLALPAATRDTLNTLAFEMRTEWQGRISATMVTRNAFTRRSIRVSQCKTFRIADQVATVGSIAEYMDEQEGGASLGSSGKHGKAIPTSLAAGQSNSAARTKVVRKPNYLAAIKLGARARGVSKKQANAIAVRQAKRSGAKVAFLQFGASSGLYRIGGGKRTAKAKLLWNFSHRAVRLKANPTMAWSYARTRPHRDGIYREKLIAQLRRFNLFGR